jgi:KAP family P-loop domain
LTLGTSDMSDRNLVDLSDDLPKEDPWREDRLGFLSFAERLSKVITGLRVPNGYVIGLQGEWGSGKSTALNFVKAFLEKHNAAAGSDTERVHVIEFRPWIVSGHQDLVAAFFKVLSESLASKRAKWAHRLFNRALRLASIGANPLLDAVATVAVTADPSAGVASKAVATVTKKSVGAMIDTFLERPSLQAAYEELRKRLGESGKRFLVTIDDLDRLQDGEIRSIMQMVKTVGRLPNIVYLLAYDRANVWRALDGERAREGPKFGEKIVQQEIELPRPSKEALLSMLDAELDFLPEVSPDAERWLYIVRDGIHRWVRHPRDALRLANAVKFTWPALAGEIDAQDLLAMEGLRLFDAPAFDWVRWNRDFLFSEGRFLLSHEREREGAVKEMRDRLPEGTRDEVMSVLSALFPSKAQLFQGTTTPNEPHGEVMKRRGIGSKAGYDAYFSLHPSPDAIPKTEIDALMGTLDDEAAITDIFKGYVDKKDKQGRPMLGELLEELRFRFQGRHPAMPTQPLLDALFRTGDQILAIERRGGLFELSPRSQLAALVTELLRLWGPADAGNHLKSAFEKSTTPAFTAAIFSDRARELGVMPSNSRPPSVITTADLDALGPMLLRLIETAAEKGTLANAPFYWDIARSWNLLGAAGKAKSWLSAGMEGSAAFLAKVTLGFVMYSETSSGRSYSMEEQPDEDIYDLNVVLAACKKHLGGRELDEDQRKRVEAVAQAIKQMLANQANKDKA